MESPPFSELASEAIQDRVLRLKRERLAAEMAAGYRLEAEQSSLDEERTSGIARHVALHCNTISC